MSFWDYFAAIAAMAVIIALAYFAARFAGKGGFSFTGGTNAGNIKIVDRFALSKDQMLVIASVGGQLYFLGVTEENVTVLDRLEPDSVTLPEPVRPGAAAGAFKDILERRWHQDKDDK